MRHFLRSTAFTRPRAWVLVLPLTLLLFALAPRYSVYAAPFDAKRVPAQAEGFLHLDLDGLRASKLWTPLSKELRKNAPAEAKKGASDPFGKDFLDKLTALDEGGIEAVVMGVIANAKGVTIWKGKKDDDFALMLELPGAAKLVPLLSAADGVTRAKSKGVTYYKGSKDDEFFASVAGDTIIVSQTLDPLLATASVASGKGKSLSTAKLKRLAALNKQGIIVIAGIGDSLMKEVRKQAASAAMSADIEAMYLVAGERGGKLFVKLEAQMKTEAAAQKVHQVVTGLIALGSLAQDDPDVGKLLSALKLSQNGTSVDVGLDMPVKDFLDLANKP